MGIFASGAAESLCMQLVEKSLIWMKVNINQKQTWMFSEISHHTRDKTSGAVIRPP